MINPANDDHQGELPTRAAHRGHLPGSSQPRSPDRKDAPHWPHPDRAGSPNGTDRRYATRGTTAPAAAPTRADAIVTLTDTARIYLQRLPAWIVKLSSR
jgi:hypothetical protein